MGGIVDGLHLRHRRHRDYTFAEVNHTKGLGAGYTIGKFDRSTAFAAWAGTTSPSASPSTSRPRSAPGQLAEILA
jgi:hypothetical protein